MNARACRCEREGATCYHRGGLVDNTGALDCDLRAGQVRKPWATTPSLADPVMLATYLARIAQFRATVSLALTTAVAIASTLRYGIDHLRKGSVDPADEPDGEDSDADSLASGLDDGAATSSTSCSSGL